jgi:hypothetical protein
MADLVETRSPREQLLAMADAARTPGPGGSRWTVLSIMRRAFGSPGPGQSPRELQVTEAEVFQRACGDESGPGYWREWLSPPDEPDDVLIKLLVTHTTLERLHEARELTRQAIDGGRTTFAREARETFEEVKRRVAEAFNAFPAGSARERVAAIANSPKTRALVPLSLRGFLEAEARPRSPAPAGETQQARPKHAQTDVLPSARPGPKESVVPRLREAMGAMDPTALATMKTEEMAAVFKAGRTTCSKIRREIFDSLVANSNGDN